MHSCCLSGSLWVCLWILFDKQQLITEPKHAGGSWRLSSALSMNDKVKLLNAGVLFTFVLSGICDCCSRTALISIDRGIQAVENISFLFSKFTLEKCTMACAFSVNWVMFPEQPYTQHIPVYCLHGGFVFAMSWVCEQCCESFRVKHFSVRYMEEYLKVKLPSKMWIIFGIWKFGTLLHVEHRYVISRVRCPPGRTSLFVVSGLGWAPGTPSDFGFLAEGEGKSHC